MSEKSVTASDGKKIYLATFEFRSGEYGQMFHKAFYATSDKDVEKQIHEYLLGYYGAGNTSTVKDGVYYYWNEEVAVKTTGWVEVETLKQVVSMLL
jgi:hypothetical protein